MNESGKQAEETISKDNKFIMPQWFTSANKLYEWMNGKR